MPSFFHIPLVLSSLLICQAVSAADWIGVDDFETHGEGKWLSSKPGWEDITGYGAATAVLDQGNSVAQIAAGQATSTSISAHTLEIPEGASGVIFLKFRAVKDSRYWGGVFGMSSKVVSSPEELNVGWTLGEPSQGSRPNATFAILGSGEDEVLLQNRGRMNKAYENFPEIKADVWYSLWVTIDNSRDEISMYIQGGDFEKRTKLTDFQTGKKDAFKFKTASASDLTHFVILNPTDPDAHNPRTLQIDELNFFVEKMPTPLAGN